MAKSKEAKKEKDQAAEYGFSKVFFDSDPELKKLLHDATSGKDAPWGTDKFTAEYRDTKWFKTHGATYRENLIQQTSDPATFNARLAQTTSALSDEAHKLGANLSSAQLQKLSQHALLYGYTDSQIQNSLGSYVNMQGSQYFGEAGDNAQTLQQSAWRNGIKISPGSLQSWVQKIASGDATTDDYQTYVRNQAASLAPGLSSELKGGQDLYDLASPYIQSMATTLELPQTSIDLFDPTIRNALNSQATDANGKAGEPTTMSLGNFEQSLRADPRWMKTSNARDTFQTTAHSILSSFGFTS